MLFLTAMTKLVTGSGNGQLIRIFYLIVLVIQFLFLILS